MKQKERERRAFIEENIISHIVPETRIYFLREENQKSFLRNGTIFD